MMMLVISAIKIQYVYLDWFLLQIFLFFMFPIVMGKREYDPLCELLLRSAALVLFHSDIEIDTQLQLSLMQFRC